MPGTTPRSKQIILGAHFPSAEAGHQTVWQDPRSGCQMDFASFDHLARTAERGKFDFFFLAEGLRLREHKGLLHDLDVVGRPNTFAVLAALAAVTTHLGLAGTISATYNEPYDVARQFATLDHLSGGRAAWNIVTSPDAFIGANFRRGGYLPNEDRYRRAAEFLRAARTLWESWPNEAPRTMTTSNGRQCVDETGAFSHSGDFFAVEGHFTTPRSPQGRPVIIQAGDSDEGREFAAAAADAVFTRHSTPKAGRAFCTDLRSRLAKYGRRHDELKIFPAVMVALGDTPAEADEHARHIRLQQVSPQTALRLIERVWNRDLSSCDPDGPFPDIDPDLSAEPIAEGIGRAGPQPDRLRMANRWREIARSRSLSIRELVIEVSGRLTFVGTAPQVAEAMCRRVNEGACDGFVLVPHLVPTGLDDFVSSVVPLLQERDALRSDYESTTLRGHLGLSDDRTGRPPDRPTGQSPAGHETAFTP
jgi:FMN-dependent oxidoreductase (nitrilotriacetate monooxygenase family)